MARLPTNYLELKPQLELIRAEDLNDIEIRARVMDFQETLDSLLIDIDDLTPEDLIIAKRVHKRGRLEGIQKACDKLFHQMSQKGGHVPAMDYLRQMSGTFKAEISPTSGSGFKFNVILDSKE
jgi:hypothetical protein